MGMSEAVKPRQLRGEVSNKINNLTLSKARNLRGRKGANVRIVTFVTNVRTPVYW